MQNQSCDIAMNQLLQSVTKHLGATIVDDRTPTSFNQLNQHNYTGIIHYNGKLAFLKIFDQDYPESYKNELYALTEFKKLNLPVPNVYHHGQCFVNGMNYYYIVMELLLGKPLQETLDHEETVSQQIFLDIGRHLRQVKESCVYLEHYLEMDFTKSSNFGKFYLSRLHNRTNETLKFISPKYYDFIWRELSEISEFDLPTTYTLVTFDWRLKHIFVNCDQISGIIDFEFTKKFDPAIDLAILFHDILLNHSFEKAKQFINNVLRGYSDNYEWDISFQRRILFYMIRQGIIHSTTIFNRVNNVDVIQDELELTLKYLEHKNIEFLLC